MKVVRDTVFQVATSVFQLRPPQPALCVAIKATFSIAPDTAECAVAGEQLPVSGDVHYDEDMTQSLQFASDLAPIKPRGECYVTGTCHPPEGRATASSVGFRIGSVARTMAVFGDRVWRATALGHEVGAPHAFTSMPLRYERCFGGREIAANPVGVGIEAIEGPGGARTPLPNIEDPTAPIHDRADRPPPAGWFPIPAMWRARASFLGTYDARWVATRWPWFAEDFNVAYFNACPHAQQITGFWRGNEDVVLQNLVPGHPRITTRLPGVRARCFVEARGATPGALLHEIPVVLDTIAIDADRLLATCLWRGMLDVASESLDGIAHLFVCDEPLSSRDDAAALRARFDRKLAELDAEDDVFEPEPVPETAAPPLQAPPPPDDPIYDALVRRVTAATGGEPQPRLPPPPGTVDQLVARLTAAGVPDASVLREIMSPPPPRPSPTVVAPGPTVVTSEQVRAMCERGESLCDRDLSNVDLTGSVMDGIEFKGTILRNATLRNARFERCSFDGAILLGADMSGSNFRAASFIDAELAGVKAVRADFGDAILDGASLMDADLTDARLVHASCHKLEATGATFVRADFSGAQLGGADLSQAKMSHAVFTGAVLVRADFSGADASRAELTDCDLTHFRATRGAKFTDAVMRNAKADGSLWSDARLERANFTFASLERADFTNAVLVQASLHGCNLKKAQFRGARLVAVGMNKSDAREAGFESADLAHADLRGSNFHAAAFWRARTDDANLQLAIVTGTLLAPKH